jgi:chorismate synthase
MPANTLGEVFRVTTYGESHGPAVGVVIDGCPGGLELSEEDIQVELDRRRPGQSKITTLRDEKDRVEILSGIFEGKTTGTPINLLVRNQDQRSKDYSHLKDLYRPSHADYTYSQKYGNRDYRGGGRSSARIMIGRTAAGAVAKKYLSTKYGIDFLAYTEQVYNIKTEIHTAEVKKEQIEANIVRCPDPQKAEEMIALIENIRQEKDSVGGVIRGLIRNLPVGLGEPEFDKLPALLAQAMLSINATKGFEIGSGFGGTQLKGSEHNDLPTESQDNKLKFGTNNAGGVMGGLSTGQEVDFRVAIKPVATIGKTQTTINKKGEKVEFEGKGRHDPCVLPRAVPIVEAMAALVIMDLVLRNQVYK